MSNHGLVMRTEKLSHSSAIWNEIFYRTPNPSPFLSYEWFYALCHSLLRIEPEIMVFWDGDRPVGIFPGIVENKTLRFIGDERVTDITDIIYLSIYEEQFLESLASLITSKDWCVDLFPLEAGSPLVRLLSELLNDVKIKQSDLSPLLSLPDSWDSYLNKLDGKERHELRRKLKKASDVALKSVGSEQIETLFQLMIASSNEKKDFLKKEVCSFFKAIAESFSKNQWLRFRVSFLDSKPIGAIFSFYFNNRIYLYNTGFDPDFHFFSPGIISIALDIKSAIDEGFKYYDFLRGEERYKFHLGAEERYTRRVMR